MRDDVIGRALNVLAILLLGWLAYVVLASLTDSGVWAAVAEMLASPDGQYSRFGVFALSFVIGLAPLLGVSAAVGWALARRR